MNEKKYIILLSSLKSLLIFCQTCKKPAHITGMPEKGMMLTVHLLCEDNHKSIWRSQPLIEGMASGNLSMAGSILLSGNTFQRIKEMMDIANVSFFSHTTYDDLQSQYIFPAIDNVYNHHKEILVAKAREEPKLDLLGDGRCDSPGYCAKYGTYTLMNSQSGEILDFHVVHVAKAGNSAKMELAGLKFLLQSMEERNLTINLLTTDRHRQVRSYMKKEKPDINHQFDIWHVSKNIKKKLVAEAKNKKCQDLNLWIKSIINHFWWCCATCKGDSLELKEKWLSLLHHVGNVHSWDDCKVFKKCQHNKLTKKETKEKVWLLKGSPAHQALEKVVANKGLLLDLMYLTSFNHTGNLEVYHSVYNKYCPKRLHFSHKGMVARSQLAVLDFNAGTNRKQATTKKGKLQYKQSYSKVTQSWVVKKISEYKKRNYLTNIMQEIERHKIDAESGTENINVDSEIPKNIAPIEKPDKKEAIKKMHSRFL